MELAKKIFDPVLTLLLGVVACFFMTIGAVVTLITFSPVYVFWLGVAVASGLSWTISQLLCLASEMVTKGGSSTTR